MNILNDVVSGAARQFGREFGRAGANSVLKGANAYIIKGVSDYSGRIKPSDSHVVKSIKNIKKVKFVTQNKANVSRLIELTDLALDNMNFKGAETLYELNDTNEMLTHYNDKFNHGSALVDDEFKGKSVDYLEQKRNEFIRKLHDFNGNIKDYIRRGLETAEKKKKSKKTAFLLSIPLLGFQWAYLKSPGYTVLSILLCWTIIVPIINLIMCIKLLVMNESKFDAEFNPEYVYFKQFNISKEP